MEHLKAMARRHWTQYLPAKVAELKKQGRLEAALTVAARRASERIQELMAQGYQAHEAEEVARAEYLLLKPEPPPEDDWEARELAELERQYRAQMRA